MELKNFYTNEGMLSERELGAIAAVLKDVLQKQLQHPPVAGSFALMEKRENTLFRMAMEFDFEGGTKIERYGNQSSDWTVKYLVARFEPTRKKSGYIATIDDRYAFDEEVLFIRLKEGSLICAVCMDFPHCEVEIYLTIAKTIAMMRSGDKRAQKAYQQLLEEEGASLPILWLIDKYVEELFEKTRLPELKAWGKRD